MSTDDRNWFEKDPYLHNIWEKSNSDDLVVNPKTWNDYYYWIDHFDENITTEALKLFLKRIKSEDIRLQGQIKEELAKQGILGKREFNKLWKTIHRSVEVLSEKIKEDPEKHLTPEETKQVEKWLNQPKQVRYDLLDELINFFIKGKKSQKLAKLIFFLLLGNVLSRELISKTDLHGDPSLGKSYTVDAVVELMPEENYIKMTNASPKALLYDKNFKEHIKFIYLHELQKNNMEMIELSKALYDGDINYIVTHYEIRDVDIFTKKRTGFLTTYSFEYTKRDAMERSWIFIPDGSHIQNKIVIDYRLARRSRRIEYDYKVDQINKKIEFFKNIIRYLRDHENPSVNMPFAMNLKEIFENNTNSRVRRDVDKLPDIIEIVALFNQKHRRILEFGKRKYLFAGYEDLKYAIDMGLEYIIDISQNLDDIKMAILDYMKIDNSENKDLKMDDLYTVTNIYNYLKNEKKDCPTRQTIGNKIRSLAKYDYLEEFDRGRGKARRYRQVKEPEDVMFDPESFKEEIEDRVDLDWNYWRNLTPELMDDEEKIEFEPQKKTKEESMERENNV